MALKYNCTVLAGYPEKVDVSPNWPTGPEYYNSAIVVNADGETIANYRKASLYYTDESWASEVNRGFYDGYIPGPLFDAGLINFVPALTNSKLHGMHSSSPSISSR